MAEESKQDLQELKATHQMLNQQLQEIEKQNEFFNEQIIDMTATKQNLDDLKETDVGSSILVPLNQGIYVKAELKDNTKLLVNVGASSIIEKSVEDTKKMLQDQIEDVKKAQQRMTENIQKIVAKLKTIEKDISSISKK